VLWFIYLFKNYIGIVGNLFDSMQSFFTGKTDRKLFLIKVLEAEPQLQGQELDNVVATDKNCQ